MNKRWFFIFTLAFSFAISMPADAKQPMLVNSSKMVKKGAVEVKSKEGLIQAIKDGANTFEAEMVFTINDYDEAEYKLNPLDIIPINSYHLTTSTLGSKATLTYNFDYLMSDKVIYAFKENSTDILDDKSIKVYRAAKKIIEEVITDDMTDYDKEKAIHDYIVLNARYDEANANVRTLNDSATPYGLLINKKGICQAYAETMKMFMNILGIECEVITGTARGVSHAWNVIKLDGKYYMLDVTWNDPLPDRPGRVDYTYFNVTAEALAKDHEWAD